MSTFEIVRGVEGDCLVLDNTRICGPKPWGGGRIIKTFCTDGIYEVIYKDEYRKLLAENAKLREQVERLQPKDCEGNALDIADTVHMLRSEYDGDHEWDDVVVELALTKWGGDRWIVRGSKGEAWACDCAKTGYDEDAYESSDDVEPIANPTLVEAENAKLRKLLQRTWDAFHDATAREFVTVKNELRELGVVVD